MYAKYAKYIGIPCTYMNQVGPIPGGKEVVVQYSSDLNSNGKFYTGTWYMQHVLIMMMERGTIYYQNVEIKAYFVKFSTKTHPFICI